MQVCVEIPGRDCLKYEEDTNGNCRLEVIGSSQMVALIRDYKKQSAEVIDLKNWPLPLGTAPEQMMLRELILKVQNKWQFPVEDPETCHCRAVPTARVDQAVVAGAHHIEKIRRWTSANTACGTCLPEIEKIISYRMKVKD